jgi:hypothetical protein
VLAPVAAKRFRNGTETVHLQWNDSLQWIETGCKMFREKPFKTILQWYCNGIFS